MEQIKISNISEELVFGQEYKLIFYNPETNVKYAGKKSEEELTFIERGEGGKFFGVLHIPLKGLVLKGADRRDISSEFSEDSFSAFYVWEKNIFDPSWSNPLFSEIEKMLEEKRFKELVESN